MARRMVTADGQLVTFSQDVRVLVSTEQEPAELWVRQFKLDTATAPGPYALQQEIPAHQSDLQVEISTPLGWVTQARLLALSTGSPLGDGQLIDEVLVPRLDHTARRTFLTDCSEGAPQIEVATGGTFLRALVASGTTTTLAQVFVGRAAPTWRDGGFPVFPPDAFLVSAVSAAPDLVHDVLVMDGRSEGWTTGPRLASGMALWFVVLVWDSDGAFDLAWSTRDAMPHPAGLVRPASQQVRTRIRRVDLHVTALVCLDDSDDASDGEATFTVGVRPSDGTPDQTRTIVWDPMESGSSKVVDETFSLRGPAAGSPRLVVVGLEDDSDSPFGDDDDGARSEPLTLTFPQGPGAEAYHREATLDAGPGDDGFRFQVHVSADVTYV